MKIKIEQASYFVLINTAHLPSELQLFLSVKNLVLCPRAALLEV